MTRARMSIDQGNLPVDGSRISDSNSSPLAIEAIKTEVLFTPGEKQEVTKTRQKMTRALVADQNSVMFPDYKTPFKSFSDEVNRLLPYHLLSNPSLDDQFFIKAEPIEIHLKQQISKVYESNQRAFAKTDSRFLGLEVDVLENRLALEEEKFLFNKMKEEYLTKYAKYFNIPELTGRYPTILPKTLPARKIQRSSSENLPIASPMPFKTPVKIPIKSNERKSSSKRPLIGIAPDENIFDNSQDSPKSPLKNSHKKIKKFETTLQTVSLPKIHVKMPKPPLPPIRLRIGSRVGDPLTPDSSNSPAPPPKLKIRLVAPPR